MRPAPPGSPSFALGRAHPGPSLAVILAMVALPGCGYAFTAGASRMPLAAERVFVRPLENHTGDAEAGALLAAALRRELARRGADGGESSPARIEGEVERSASQASAPGNAAYRLTLEVQARLLVGEKVVAAQRVQRSEDYLGEVDALATEGRRRLALRRAAEGAARDIVERFEAP
jgi:outer membrane lipopolysaccharide assembly protein LptE/RlpB